MELSDTDYDGIYEGVYDNFTAKGTYKISIYATDAGGVFSPPAHTEVIQMCPRGDITGDGIVSLADAIAALKATAGEDISVLCSVASADVSGNGSVGAEEAIQIMQDLIHLSGDFQ